MSSMLFMADSPQEFLQGTTFVIICLLPWMIFKYEIQSQHSGFIFQLQREDSHFFLKILGSIIKNKKLWWIN